MGKAEARRSHSDLTPSAPCPLSWDATEAMAYCLNPICPQPQNPAAANFCQTCGTSLILEGHYKLKSLLGQGGFGKTYLAIELPEQQTSGSESKVGSASAGNERLCVIKQFYARATSRVSGFKTEAERLRKLGEHPQIPKLFAAIENELGQFLVQEYAPGENLQQRVAAVGTFREPDVRSLLSSLVKVLQYVHSFQIIHRDIKPANIVYQASSQAASLGNSQSLSTNRTPSQSAPMLVDFGAAKWVRHTAAKTVIGSAGYAAPEQSMGQATYASDIYSLGLTCLHLLTGVHPFSLYSAAEDKWVWQDYITTPLEPHFAQVLSRMVCRSLQERYATIDEVAQDLQSSQRLYQTFPKQLLEQAKASMPGLTKRLKREGSAVMERFGLSDARPSLPASARLANRLVSSDSAQHWHRRHRLAPDIGLTQALATSPDGQQFASGGADGAVHLWHLPSGELQHTFAKRRLIGNGHTDGITALRFHPDSRALYSASADGTLKEWDSAARSLLNTLPTAGWTTTDLQIDAHGRSLISANSDGQIVIWDIGTLLPVAQLAQHQSRVSAIALAPEGTLLASISTDGSAKLWKWEQQVPKLSKTISLAQLHKRFGKETTAGVGVAIAIASSSNIPPQLIIATDHLVVTYPLSTSPQREQPVSLYYSPHTITAMALSRNGTVAIGTEDRLLTLWDIETGDCVAQLAHDWGIKAIAFSKDGNTLITATADEVISIWENQSIEKQ